MSFERPVMLSALLLAPLVASIYVFVQGRSRPFAVVFPNVEVLATVAHRSRRRDHLPSALWLIALSLLCFAIAGPTVTWTGPVRGGTVVLAVDTSKSMLTDDVLPTRLDAAKQAARSFLESVPGGFRVGVVVFAGDVAVGALPTSDREVVQAAIDAIVPRESSGTAIGDALARSVEVGQLPPAGEEAASASPASILFLSDGRQEDGLLRPLEGSARARAAGIPVYTVALGTEGGARQSGPTGVGFFYDNVGSFRVPDLETMRTIAFTTGGDFFEARTAAVLTRAYESLGNRLGRAQRTSDVTVAFVGIAAVGLLAAVLLSALWWPRVP